MGMFTVDDEGWIAQNKNRELWELAREAVQNALDTGEDVYVGIDTGGRKIVVEDQGEGYSELQYAWQVFGGDKGDDPTLRGRFSRGIKESITACSEAVIETTCGKVTFDVENRERTVNKEFSRERGTKVVLHNPEWPTYEVKNVFEYVNEMWCPPGQEITVDLKGGRTSQKSREAPDGSFSARLPTEVYDEDSGGMEKKWRRAKVFYRKVDGRRDGTLYEMGIPVKKDCDFPFHVDVQQRIPMAEQRNEPDQSWYERKFIPLLVKKLFDAIPVSKMRDDWVLTGLNNHRADIDQKEEFVEKVVKDGRKKDLVVATGGKADRVCKNRGYQVYNPDQAGSATASIVRDVAPSARDVAEDLEDVREEKLEPTPGEREFIEKMEEMAELIGVDVEYEVWAIEESFDGSQVRADYQDDGTIRLNRQASDWSEFTPDNVGTALIHEPAHRNASRHENDRFWRTMQEDAGKVICELME